MFNLIFGLVWTIFSTFCFSLMFVDGGNFEPAIIPFALLFEGVGIWLIVSGEKQVITNKKTDIVNLVEAYIYENKHISVKLL